MRPVDLAEAAHGLAGRLGVLRRPSPGRRMVLGAAAGALGTTALNAATYLDMLVRGRPASETPAELVKRIERAIAGARSDPKNKEARRRARNRREAAGALHGAEPGTAARRPEPSWDSRPVSGSAPCTAWLNRAGARSRRR
jgi:hypothetical protein